MSEELLASELYAISQGELCQGPDRCHWCGAPCKRELFHDDIPPTPFLRGRSTAKCPGSSFICVGCSIWRRKRTTINYLTPPNYKDGQCAINHSWWVTEKGAWALTPKDNSLLYDCLVSPPLTFSLSLLINGPVASGILPHPGAVNHLHLNLVNDLKEIKANTLLNFTINSVPHQYSIYELEEGLLHGGNGKEPGVGALVNLLGPVPAVIEKSKEKRSVGRPSKSDLKEMRRTVIKDS